MIQQTNVVNNFQIPWQSRAIFHHPVFQQLKKSELKKLFGFDTPVVHY